MFWKFEGDKRQVIQTNVQIIIRFEIYGKALETFNNLIKKLYILKNNGAF